MSHQDPEEAVACIEAAVTYTTDETIGSQRDLSNAVPSTTSPSEAKREPVADKELCEGNTTNEATVATAENVGDPALLHAKQQAGPKSVLHEKNTNETAARITKTSTTLLQKAPETQDHLGSGSEMRNTKTYPQVSNTTCIVAIFVFWDTIHLKPFSQLAANLKFVCMHLNLPYYTCLRERNLLNYQLKNEVRKADFNTYKRIYNWQPFMKRVYRGESSWYITK